MMMMQHHHHHHHTHNPLHHSYVHIPRAIAAAEDVTRVYTPRQVYVHTHLALALFIAAFVSFIYIMWLPSSIGYVRDGRLMYISEGFESQCGLTTVFLGTSGALIAGIFFVVGLHTTDSYAAALAFLVFISWLVLISVIGTGWIVHDISLGIFFVCMSSFHYIMARTKLYGSSVYIVLNFFFMFVVLCFGFVFILIHSGAFDSDIKQKLISTAVVCEYIIVLFNGLQAMVVSYRLKSTDSYIFLTFLEEVVNEEDALLAAGEGAGGFVLRRRERGHDIQ